MKKSIISFTFLISVILVSAQNIQDLTDAEIYKILQSGTWSHNPHEFTHGWQFCKDGRASKWGPVVSSEKKYFVKRNCIYLSKIWDKESGFKELKNEELSKFNVIELKYESESFYSKYSIIIDGYKYYVMNDRWMKGELRKFGDYQILMGDYPESKNDEELYIKKPGYSQYTIFSTRFDEYFYSSVYTLKDISRFGSSIIDRNYIGSTIVENHKWYLVTITRGPEYHTDDSYTYYAWTDGQTKPVSIIYDYYHAINTQDWAKGYELSHKKIDFETWKSIYEGCNIDIYGSHKLADFKWKFIVRLTDSAKEITWYEVEFTLGDKSILSSKSTVTYERVMGK